LENLARYVNGMHDGKQKPISACYSIRV